MPSTLLMDGITSLPPPARRIGTVGKKDSVETLSLFNVQNLSLLMWSVHGPFTSESPGEFITNDV